MEATLKHGTCAFPLLNNLQGERKPLPILPIGPLRVKVGTKNDQEAASGRKKPQQQQQQPNSNSFPSRLAAPVIFLAVIHVSGENETNCCLLVTAGFSVPGSSSPTRHGEGSPPSRAGCPISTPSARPVCSPGGSLDSFPPPAPLEQLRRSPDNS